MRVAAFFTGGAPEVINLTLYSRSYCHLCDDMSAALNAFQSLRSFQVNVVDVDADALLVARYDELVPVLIGHDANGAEIELCHYFLSGDAVRDFLLAQPA
ncbi:thiol-disulfide isomerase/thioredoxin [Actimicrobium sp. GrIS 1.19]|uniref:glutaredoxin family protein n=1 Tax=Actimicrobium sp. GrIS 1.19 TaxID=3071708 RepID=UPI002DFB3530|nr:thiol-disulfide isomerase/thioredoxin [Actimicrobium sp. GrIS 1.19]